MPLAILLLAGAFIMAGILTFAPAGDTFAADDVCGANVVPNVLGGYDVTAAGAPADATNVQCAVDNADLDGTVSLSGTFDFGADNVIIENSVKIIGDGTAKIDKSPGWAGESAYATFYVRDPDHNDPDQSKIDIDVEIRNITFIGQSFSYMLVRSCNNITIADNTLNPGANYAIAVGGGEPYNQKKVRGTVIIEGNYVNSPISSAPIPTPTFSIWSGVTHEDGTVYIRDNEVENFTAAGIGLFENWGTAYIEGNTARVNYDSAYGMGGIAVNNGRGSYPLLCNHPYNPDDPEEYCPYTMGEPHVLDNTVICNAEGGMGITFSNRPTFATLFGGSVTGNHITVNQGATGIGLYGIGTGDSDGVLVEDNVIVGAGDGVGMAGIYLNGTEVFGDVENNSITDNIIRGTADYGIKLEGSANNNSFGDINLQNKLQELTVNEKYIYCGVGTSGNSFCDFSFPEDTEDKWYEDLGENIFDNLDETCEW
jgi:parallel beta-helix repeat protein